MKFKKLLNLLRNSKNMFKSMWDDNRTRTIELDSSSLNWGRGSSTKKDERIAKKPVDIFEEIISEEPKINLSNLNGQIKLVKGRMKALQQHMKYNDMTHEKTAIQFLEARKKYTKHMDKFRWAITNQELIDKLCKKYKVQMVTLDNYYRLVPKEGVDEIQRFGEANRCVSKNEPLFKLIISDEEKPKDPILLARSPFGNWWYVLGAWDKEVEIVDKLIYKRE